MRKECWGVVEEESGFELEYGTEYVLFCIVVVVVYCYRTLSTHTLYVVQREEKSRNKQHVVNETDSGKPP